MRDPHTGTCMHHRLQRRDQSTRRMPHRISRPIHYVRGCKARDSQRQSRAPRAGSDSTPASIDPPSAPPPDTRSLVNPIHKQTSRRIGWNSGLCAAPPHNTARSSELQPWRENLATRIVTMAAAANQKSNAISEMPAYSPERRPRESSCPQHNKPEVLRPSSTFTALTWTLPPNGFWIRSQIARRRKNSEGAPNFAASSWHGIVRKFARLCEQQ